MKSSTAILLGLLALGIYLLYRSVQNVGYAVNATLANTSGVVSGAANTLQAEANAVGSAVLSPFTLFSTLGTNAYNAAGSVFGGLSGGSTTVDPFAGLNFPNYDSGTDVGGGYTVPDVNQNDSFMMPDGSGTVTIHGLYGVNNSVMDTGIQPLTSGLDYTNYNGDLPIQDTIDLGATPNADPNPYLTMP